MAVLLLLLLVSLAPAAAALLAGNGEHGVAEPRLVEIPFNFTAQSWHELISERLSAELTDNPSKQDIEGLHALAGLRGDDEPPAKWTTEAVRLKLVLRAVVDRWEQESYLSYDEARDVPYWGKMSLMVVEWKRTGRWGELGPSSKDGRARCPRPPCAKTKTMMPPASYEDAIHARRLLCMV